MKLQTTALGFLVAAAFLLTPSWAQAQQKEIPLPGGFPDLEKLLPPGTIDPEQLKMLKQLLEGQGDLQKMIEDLQKQLPGMPDLKLPNMPFAAVSQENRLGAMLQPPNKTLVDQLDLPARQGLVL